MRFNAINLLSAGLQPHVRVKVCLIEYFTINFMFILYYVIYTINIKFMIYLYNIRECSYTEDITEEELHQ